MANGYIQFATQAFSASYPSLDKPDTTSAYPSGKYEVSGYFNEADDSATLATLRKAVADAANAEWPGVNVDGLNNPLKTQEDGSVRVKLKSARKPALQDAKGNALADDVVIGPGDLVRVAGVAKAYNTGGNKGITFYLNTTRLIDKRSHGDGTDPFGGPDDGFAAKSEADIPF